MPVNRLLVEGELDNSILIALLAGAPLVNRPRGGKGSLAPAARNYRDVLKEAVCYIRDRDFDHEPPSDLSQPTIAEYVDNTKTAVLGWRWCRLEIENYLLEPALLHAALGWDINIYTAELLQAAQRIKHYQAARWAIGRVRRQLPPSRAFPSKPSECANKDFRLPDDYTETGCRQWITSQATTFQTSINAVLDTTTLQNGFDTEVANFDTQRLQDVPQVLLWCSGKDLLTEMSPWLRATHRRQPNQIIENVSDWIVENMDETLRLLPEWAAFREAIRAYP